MSTPPLLLFLHVPKTGGTTMRRLLARQFAPEAVLSGAPLQTTERKRYTEYLLGQADRPHNMNRNQRVVDQIQALEPDTVAGLRLLQDHFFFGLHEHIERPCTYVTMLRHPVDRVLSLYEHRRRVQGLDQTLAEYVRAGRDFELDNGQTRRLAGNAAELRWIDCTPELLETAQHNLVTHFAWVGINERFDESLLALRQALDIRNLHYRPLNRSPGRPRREQLPADLLAELERRSEYDMELYRFAERLLDERGGRLASARGRALRWRTRAVDVPRSAAARSYYGARRAGSRVKRAIRSARSTRD